MYFILKICATIFLVISILFSNTLNASAASVDSSELPQQLPFCNDDVEYVDRNIGLLYVSTLDGKISALDLLNKGKLKWTMNTSPGQMISSSIQELELTNNGRMVRMIPSLSGSIYKFDEESVEPMPINADNLLSSSFKFSDDLVISGGKETISYGVSAHSGRVLYECSMKGCINSTSEIDSTETKDNNELPIYDATMTDDEIIIVRRQTQIVRAIEPKTGEERWNFSVGQHELELYPMSADCHSKNTHSELHDILTNLEIKVIVPDGIICAVQKNSPNVIWKHKFDHPIVKAWKRDEENQLKAIDLFQSVHGMWQYQGKSWAQQSITDDTNDLNNVMPSIYIGMFKRQVYIQESDQLRQQQTKFNDHTLSDGSGTRSFGRIPWKPIDAKGLQLIDNEHVKSLATTTSDTDNRNDLNSAARSILYGSEYVNGNGFYLYAKTGGQKAICDKSNNSNDNSDNVQRHSNVGTSDSDFDDTVDKISLINVIYMWYRYWLELTLTAFSSVLIFKVLTHRAPTEKKVPATLEHKDNVLLPAIEYHPSQTTSETDTKKIEYTYTSRFQSDFEMLQCLGKGGFGVVFEAKNILDDCNYAIKRIVLPKNKQSRERVMREVKTLANCEHQNIVRYFQAWVESPPPGWQDKEDRIWMDRYALSHSIDIDSPSSDEPTNKKKFNAVCQQQIQNSAFHKTKSNSLISNFQINECTNFDKIIRTTNPSDYNKDDNNDNDDDSFIVFASNANEKQNTTGMDESDTSSEIDESNNQSNSVFEPSNDNSGKPKRKKKTARERRSQFQHFGDKKRCHSMNDSIAFSQSVGNNDYGIDMNFPNDECDVISEKPIKIAVKKPFKRTHRRPLSLDLTSNGSVQIAATNVLPITYLYIQMQLCRKQSLKDWLFDNDAQIRTNESLVIFKQIIEAVEYVHLKGLIHRDLKPSNIFFSLDGQIKIGDFGLVTDMSENLKVVTPCGDESGLPSCAKHTAQVGTQLYMSPEQLRGRQYNYKVDIYSLGVILFELLMIFNTEMERIVTIKQLRSNIYPTDFEEKFPNEFKLLKLMLSKEPNERPTTYGIRAKPPFSESTDESHHFELPPLRRDSQYSSNTLSSSSSNSSCLNLKSMNKCR